MTSMKANSTILPYGLTESVLGNNLHINGGLRAKSLQSHTGTQIVRSSESVAANEADG